MIVDSYIMAFQNNYEWDDIDDFEDPKLIERIEEHRADYEDGEMPSEMIMAEVVRSALYFIQYGDTSDADDIETAREDYHKRFPNGR